MEKTRLNQLTALITCSSFKIVFSRRLAVPVCNFRFGHYTQFEHDHPRINCESTLHRMNRV